MTSKVQLSIQELLYREHTRGSLSEAYIDPAQVIGADSEAEELLAIYADYATMKTKLDAAVARLSRVKR
jgi:hypothetical protein